MRGNDISSSLLSLSSSPRVTFLLPNNRFTAGASYFFFLPVFVPLLLLLKFLSDCLPVGRERGFLDRNSL
jgi:hypothetical protein